MAAQIITAMATKTLVQVLDDLDGTEGAETLTFAVDGVTYEIDLNESNRTRFEKAVAPFMESARRIGRAGRIHSGAPRKASKGQGVGQFGTPSQTVRDWAKENGITIGDKGRIPTTVIESFDAAKTSGSSTNGAKPRRAPAKKAPAKKAAAKKATAKKVTAKS